MTTKPWYKRSTTYAGVALIVKGVGIMVADGDYSMGLTEILTGIGILGLRRAVANRN
jgi:hypothetical protein